MDHLNQNTAKITEMTAVGMNAPEGISFKNPFSIPPIDRRRSDRRRTETSHFKKITIVIPALNEEQAIGPVIKEDSMYYNSLK